MVHKDKLQALLDKDQIKDVLMRYTRGVDRRDRVALESAYWPDATDDHITYVGDASGFVEFAFAFTAEMRTHHLVGQILIEFESELIARSETYYIATHDMPTSVGRQDLTMKGRYIDRFEKRGDEWRIIKRAVTCDLYEIAASTTDWNSPIFAGIRTRGEPYPLDPVYTLFRSAT